MMNVKRSYKRAAALLAVLLMLGNGLSVFAARPQGFDANGCMPLITEPGESVQSLIYCRGDRDLTIDEVNWVDSDRGKAVQFNGVDEYFRIPYKNLQVSDFTLSFWVNWQGASDAEGGSGLSNQRIFSARAMQYGKRYITLSPMETTAEGSDGLRLHMRYENSDWDLHRAQAGPLAQNEWHHVAIVATAQTLALYLDGVLMDQQTTMMDPAQMNLFQFYIGKGPTMGGDGYFNGLMDNVYLYKWAMNVDNIGGLIATQQPSAPTTTPAPTVPTTTLNSTEVTPDVQQKVDYSLPPIPPIVWIVSGTVAALIVALIVTVNVRYAKAQKAVASLTEDEDE